MADYVVRALPPNEWPRYRVLRLEALEFEPLAFAASFAENVARPDTYWIQRLADAASDRHEWLFFAELDHHLVGMVGAMVKDRADTAELMAMYVSASARGNGVGASLILRVLHELANHPSITWLELHVKRGQTAAIHLYQRLGFVMTDDSCLPAEAGTKLHMRRLVGTSAT